MLKIIFTHLLATFFWVEQTLFFITDIGAASSMTGQHDFCYLCPKLDTFLPSVIPVLTQTTNDTKELSTQVSQ